MDVSLAPLAMHVRRKLIRDGVETAEIALHLGVARLVAETGLSPADAADVVAWAGGVS